MAAKGCVEWLEAKPGRGIGQVILAAADIDADYFTHTLAPQLTAGTERITVYVAPDDKALAMAEQIHYGTRIGATVVEIPGVDTVEVSWRGLRPQPKEERQRNFNRGFRGFHR